MQCRAAVLMAHLSSSDMISAARALTSAGSCPAVMNGIRNAPTARPAHDVTVNSHDAAACRLACRLASIKTSIHHGSIVEAKSVDSDVTALREHEQQPHRPPRLSAPSACDPTAPLRPGALPAPALQVGSAVTTAVPSPTQLAALRTAAQLLERACGQAARNLITSINCHFQLPGSSSLH